MFNISVKISVTYAEQICDNQHHNRMDINEINVQQQLNLVLIFKKSKQTTYPSANPLKNSVSVSDRENV